VLQQLVVHGYEQVREGYPDCGNTQSHAIGSLGREEHREMGQRQGPNRRFHELGNCSVSFRYVAKAEFHVFSSQNESVLTIIRVAMSS
jgi:hypothetical protein